MIRIPLDKLTRFKLSGYVLWFTATFFFMLYQTFPIASFQEHVQGLLASTLRQTLPGRNDVQVWVEDLALWRLSGLRLNNVRVRVRQRGKANSPSVQLDLDRVRARVGLLPLLIGSTSVSWNLILQKQSLSGAVSTNKAGQLTALRLRVPNMDLSHIDLLPAALGVPLQGKLRLTADLNLSDGKPANLSGSLALSATQMGIGPGPLALPKSSPLGSSLDIPAVALGNLTVRARGEKGTLKISELKLTGGDAEADITADVKLNNTFTRGRLNGKGWFRLSPALFKKQQGLEDLLELSPELQRAKDAKGRYAFKLQGTVRRPNFVLGK